MKRYDSRKTYLLRWKKKYEHLIEDGTITEEEMCKYEKLKKELSLVEELSALHDSEKVSSSNRGGVRIGCGRKRKPYNTKAIRITSVFEKEIRMVEDLLKGFVTAKDNEEYEYSFSGDKVKELFSHIEIALDFYNKNLADKKTNE